MTLCSPRTDRYAGRFQQLFVTTRLQDKGHTVQAAPEYLELINGGVNTAVMTGMPTKTYREVQVNLRLKEAAREAFTDSMLGMTGMINALVRDNLAEGSSMGDGLLFMQDKCSGCNQVLPDVSRTLCPTTAHQVGDLQAYMSHCCHIGLHTWLLTLW